MRAFLAAIGLLLGLSGWGANSLLILTEPTARGLAGRVFDRWVNVIRDEGNFPGGVIVREHDRWDRNWTNQNWTALGRMSNDVALIRPTHIQIVGSLPVWVGGSHIDDGHEYRCGTGDNWLGCTNLVWFDATNHTEMTGYNASSAPLNRNIPGDGRPDNDYGWFLRPVMRIDFAGVSQPSDDTTWSSGCLAGQSQQPALDEGYSLRAYLTNDIAYRTGAWSNTASGIFTGGLWVGGAGDTPSKAATNYMSHFSWTRSASALAPGTARIYYESWAANEVDGMYDGGCAAPRALIDVCYRSWCMEVWWNYNIGARRIGPTRTSNPYFLVYAWTNPTWVDMPYWVSGPSDTIVFDMISGSIARIGDGTILLRRMVLGDGTIPLSAKRPRGTLTVTNLTFAP